MRNNRIKKSNPDDLLKSNLLQSLTTNPEVSEQNIIFGVVVKNIDPLNANRIKIRIPVMDDKHFENVDYETGVNNLPWCLPFNRNFISTPEINSIVAVELMNIKTPSVGRIFIDCLTELSDTGLFDMERLREEYVTYMNFDNLESATNLRAQRNEQDLESNESEKVVYEIGIRGKGKNKFLFTKNETQIIQNENNKESKFIMNESILIETSNEMKLRSKKGGTEYHPVFHKPLYDYINDLNGLVKTIVMILNTVPSLSSLSGVPNSPSPSANQLISKLVSLYKHFAQLKIDGNGHSKYIWVN